MRIQRALARAGVASRRRADELVASGRVHVNGEVARIGQLVDPERDLVSVHGRRVPPPTAPRWLAMHKPAGVVTTRRDPSGRRTVFDLLEPIPGLTYVGRLDYLTEGLLLLTTDGAAAHRLTHPRYEVERSYIATVRGNAGAALRHGRRGVSLEDGTVTPRALEVVPRGAGRWELHVTLTEGRNREVRRFCEALGLSVERLVRTRFGPVTLGALPTGAARPLTRRELQLLETIVNAEHQS